MPRLRFVDRWGSHWFLSRLRRTSRDRYCDVPSEPAAACSNSTAPSGRLHRTTGFLAPHCGQRKNSRDGTLCAHSPGHTPFRLSWRRGSRRLQGGERSVFHPGHDKGMDHSTHSQTQLSDIAKLRDPTEPRPVPQPGPIAALRKRHLTAPNVVALEDGHRQHRCSVR